LPAPRPPVSSRGQLAPPAAPPELSKPTRLARTAPRLSSRSRPSPRHHRQKPPRRLGPPPCLPAPAVRSRGARTGRRRPAGACSLAGSARAQRQVYARRQAPWRANKRYPARVFGRHWPTLHAPSYAWLHGSEKGTWPVAGAAAAAATAVAPRVVRRGGSCSVTRQVFRHRTPTWILEYARHHQHRELIMQGAQRSTSFFFLFVKKTAECVTTDN